MAVKGHTLFKPDYTELEEDVSESPLWNEDLAPVPILKRNWTTYNYAALWISMAHCIPTYMLASSLIDLGMNWWQALMTILLGNMIVLAPISLNSHPGAKYGITFPVFAEGDGRKTRGSMLEDNRDDDDQYRYDGLGRRQARHPLGWAAAKTQVAEKRGSQPNTGFPIAALYIILVPCRTTSHLL